MIYVDRYIDQIVPKMWRGGGHMLTSDIEELHAMADTLKLKREWFQDTAFPHYDLTRNKRHAAMRAGAVQIGGGDLPDDILMRKRGGGYEPRSERLARRRAARVIDQ